MIDVIEWRTNRRQSTPFKMEKKETKTKKKNPNIQPKAVNLCRTVNKNTRNKRDDYIDEVRRDICKKKVKEMKDKYELFTLWKFKAISTYTKIIVRSIEIKMGHVLVLV